MSKKTLFIALAALIVLAAGAVLVINRPHRPGDDMGQDHSATYLRFAALKGEAYDRTFLADMIAHHQGAVDMANLALNQTKHAELKAMAQNIISAQAKEINDMTAWQQQWGYPASSGEHMMDHGAMGMEHDMAEMTNQLKYLTGDVFDQKFLQLMIDHHQSAIDMARPGETNAKHQEVKDLTKAIVADQSKEIDQMQSWQGDWGYKTVPRSH